jgi:hypothetical protein
MDTPFLPGYSGQSIGELIELKDKYRIDSLVLAVEEAVGSKADSDLSEPERVVLAVEAMEREVNNGGYNQMFFNSSSDHVGFLVRALEQIGCPKTAAISAKAISVLNLPDNFDGDLVRDAVMQLSDAANAKLNECDSQYYTNDEPIVGRLFEYIERERGRIRIP